MKPTYSMDDTQWDKLIDHVSKYFDDLTIKRGFQYFKQERVQQFTMPEPEHLEAVVEGNEPYRVDIRLNTFLSSHCTCPVQGNCKHMIAVLLHYASLLERPIHAIVNAKSNVVSKQAKHAHAAPLAASTLTKLKEQASKIPTMSIAQWHELFELCCAPLSDSTPNAQYVKDTAAVINKIKPPLSPIKEQLFGLHLYLFILEKLVKQSQHQPQNQWRTSGYYMGFHTHVAADDVRETIDKIFANELAISSEPEHWSSVIETLAYLRRRMLTESQSLTYFSDLYSQLWIKWIHPALQGTSVYMEELAHLLAAKEELGSALSKLPWLAAQIRMHFYLSQDQEAWSLLQTAGSSSVIRSEDLYSFLHELSDAKAWPRLVNWLVEAGPLLSSYRKGSMQPYSVYWERAVQALPEAEPQMWKSLVLMLPYSRDIYEETLITHGRWLQWMDYHLSTGSMPHDFRVSDLQPIEKQAPELLLPFYHQAVERFILEKNRHSYKAAVKLLKRLFKLYKKMKQEDRWELFFTAFSDRHSRLRALQEELRKGKLLT
ncbi:hypothetical protein Back11_42950 [Paenibacillus baekrokdamisoli]|uniref:Uncharacterized protein n=1 Tax=Paenibacillus baekrokdamisoli TaxID=1712516 RepID=A0A3G9IVU1_9BACL|nr:SWIM zinc finger family protein [Paenibacillus baekrokdamisoli]MBB3068002.1 hypothetical protein [Paenibacillus baekrokdamisoli]BBH22950.1 hypothetical protein Back11_42950 [Paenibacillus baekrokdamisoli]